MTSPAPPAIATAGLTRRYGETIAVDGLTWTVPAGTICGLVGPDGAGKTTTIRLLCGLIPPDAGAARVAGVDVVRQPERVKPLVGYVAQRFAIYGDLTIAENLRFFADAYGVSAAEREARSRELLALTRLSEFTGRLADHLSGGMRQKLSLACALLHRPAVLFLDEPTTGVDPVSRRDLWALLHRLNGDGLTIAMSTPYMDEASRCHDVAFLSRGRLLAGGTPQALRDRLAGRVLALRATPLPAARPAAAAAPGVRSVQVLGDRLHLLLDTPDVDPDTIRAHVTRAGVHVHSLALATPAMEDVFVSLASSEEKEDG
ncbi:MAG: ABC transporter ATP-binding protein [Chloroflexi bacterium]|nr:ABC transporter ATP-binding protein [Chloroflexota bacterium]